MKPIYRVEGESFVIENYNQADPYSSFFPGLAGETGKPMWVFYTNRGQAISSFGVNNKDGAMLEFLPANKAYQATPLLGFRTFVRTAKTNSPWYEPFHLSQPEAKQTLIVRPYDLVLKETNKNLGLEFEVQYFGVPNESCPLLARALTIRNLRNRPAHIVTLDGLPRVVPWGMGDFLVKNMSRTIEAFAEVVNYQSSVPFFKLKVKPDDKPDVEPLHGGFFSFTVGDNQSLLPIVVDPNVVFAHDLSFLSPSSHFGTNGASLNNQLTSNIMPSSFSHSPVRLKPKEEKTWHSYYGYAENIAVANKMVEKIRTNPSYFQTKENENVEIHQNLVKHFGLVTSNPILDSYANNSFMDNVLRGGFPTNLTPSGPLIHVYSRKHGDMERDYNAFQISATYYSQGNGNFRDVNQNRRHDVFLNPQAKTVNVDFFFNLIQLDGFNPLIINPMRFAVPKDLERHSGFLLNETFRAEYHQLMREPVLTGQIYEFAQKHAKDPLSVSALFREVIQKSFPSQGIQHGDGFWIDHWIYNLDQLDQYLAIYPDQKQWLLFEKKDFTYYDSDHSVSPRKEKYHFTKEGKFRQYQAVTIHPEKQTLMASRKIDPNRVRTQNGAGEIFRTTLFVKLLSLVIVKASSLDPHGMGIEMEAGKPGWCDALNGAPALFGSSSEILFELIRLVRFMEEEVIPLCPTKTTDLPKEIYSFMRDVDEALAQRAGKDFRPFWDKLAGAREHFREKTLFGLSGKMRVVKLSDIKEFLMRVSKTLNSAEKKVIDPATRLPTAYFTYDVDVSKLSSDWRSHLYKIPFVQHRVAPFLEGVVHPMKVYQPVKCKTLYQRVRKSELRDKKLGMYKLNVSLEKESSEIGRVRVFSGGWLENESIFLHMHYKFLLEVLRAGMTKEFLEEIKEGLIPFRDMKTYGRPIFENSSFIASSAFPKKEVHGKGFVARLSGATSEFLSMVYFMMFGSKPFVIEEGEVVFWPKPQLPGEWFTKTEANHIPKNSISLTLLGVPIRLLSPKRKDTFGAGGVKPVAFEWIYEGRFYTHKGPFLPHEPSLALREGRLESLSIFLN